MNTLKLKIPKKTLDVQVTTMDAVLEFQIDVSGVHSYSSFISCTAKVHKNYSIIGRVCLLYIMSCRYLYSL